MECKISEGNNGADYLVFHVAGVVRWGVQAHGMGFTAWRSGMAGESDRAGYWHSIRLANGSLDWLVWGSLIAAQRLIRQGEAL